jgi:hypothetical protein
MARKNHGESPARRDVCTMELAWCAGCATKPRMCMRGFGLSPCSVYTAACGCTNISRCAMLRRRLIAAR